MKKSLISAIKKLLTKLGAEEIEGNNLVEVIDSGADAIEGDGGSGGGVLVVHVEDGPNDTFKLDKTWQEVYDAPVSVFVSGDVAIGEARITPELYITQGLDKQGNPRYTITYYQDHNYQFVTNSPEGYPATEG